MNWDIGNARGDSATRRRRGEGAPHLEPERSDWRRRRSAACALWRTGWRRPRRAVLRAARTASDHTATRTRHEGESHVTGSRARRVVQLRLKIQSSAVANLTNCANLPRHPRARRGRDVVRLHRRVLALLVGRGDARVVGGDAPAAAALRPERLGAAREPRRRRGGGAAVGPLRGQARARHAAWPPQSPFDGGGEDGPAVASPADAKGGGWRERLAARGGPRGRAQRARGRGGGMGRGGRGGRGRGRGAAAERERPTRRTRTRTSWWRRRRRLRRRRRKRARTRLRGIRHAVVVALLLAAQAVVPGGREGEPGVEGAGRRGCVDGAPTTPTRARTPSSAASGCRARTRAGARATATSRACRTSWSWAR